MFDFHEKRKIRNILYSWPVIAVLVFCTIVLSVSVYHRYTVAHDMGVKLSAREHELEELKQQAEILDAKVEYLKNDRGIEEELRNRFDVVREGEKVVIFTGEAKQPNEESDTTKPSDSTTESESFWSHFKFW